MVSLSINRFRFDDDACYGGSGERWSVYAEVRNVFHERYIATHDVRDAAAPDAAILNPGAPLPAYAGLRWRLR